MKENYYIVVQKIHSDVGADVIPRAQDLVFTDYILMTFKSEEFALQVAEDLMETFEDEYFFYVTTDKPEDYLEDSYPSVYTMLITKVYSTVMQAIDGADDKLSKRKKPYLWVVK
tara:strand:+ start:776 stop:1117 length:342 start_codon:yes stop_codon:yes gene_type:complete